MMLLRRAPAVRRRLPLPRLQHPDFMASPVNRPPRSAPCPCGSGKRYKQCCGALADAGAPASRPVPAAATGASTPAVAEVDLAREFERAQQLHQAGRAQDAEQAYGRILERDPSHAGALHYRGVCRFQRGAFDDAVHDIERALALHPAERMARNNLGLAYRALSRPDDALRCFTVAIAEDPADAVALNNRGLVHSDLGDLDAALVDFTGAVRLRASFVEARVNLAKAHLERADHAQAVASAEQAIALAPSQAQAHAIRASALRELGRVDEAIAGWDRAIALAPRFAEAHRNRGSALHDFGRHEAAVASLAEAAKLDPELPYLAGDWLGERMQCCDWAGFDPAVAAIREGLAGRRRCVTPFTLLALPSTLQEQSVAARLYAGDHYGATFEPLSRGERYAHERIRIAYLSSDFRSHPMAHLITAMIEAHDRQGFEVMGFYTGPAVADEWHARIGRAFDRFFEVGGQSDAAIAALLRELEIDVAVDLGGHTSRSPIGVLAHRPAPVQAHYMGYPGTLGATFVDYLVADPVLIPASERAHYDERIAYLPHSYQANDRGKAISTTATTRADHGLPADAIVFCGFNAIHKVTPHVFDAWMRVLDRVPNGVLWLREPNETARRNLRREMASRGIAPARLFFAPRLPLAEHLERHRLADLFLDTFPYNAHTTASDALWAGLPVLTKSGDTFASRVAASLLHAVGLPELVARDTQDYERIAVGLASDPAALRAIREKLARNRLDHPLFDTERTARDFEVLYRAMHARSLAGLPPEHILPRADSRRVH